MTIDFKERLYKATDYVWMWQEEDAKSYEKLSGPWIVANVDQQIGWPEKRMLVKFQGIKLLLLPGENELYPAVALRHNSELTYSAAYQLIMHFLSSLSWAESSAIQVISWGGGGMPNRMLRQNHITISNPHFRITYLPEPKNENARLALAFYREALSLKHIAYSFLSYYKIINLRFHMSGNQQKEWMSLKLDSLEDRDARIRLEELKAERGDVVEYLYRSCRCAIAHAGVDPTIDPDNFEDDKRLSADLPIIKNLSELLIEEQYGIKRPRKIWEEHLYELSGFKRILGDEFVEKLKINEPNLAIDSSIFKLVSVRLWGEKKIRSLEKLKTSCLKTDDNNLVLNCISEKRLVQIRLILDFKNERLIFNPDNGITIFDDGSIKAAEFVADVYEFVNKYYGNGSLEVWDPQEEICLGRCNRFIPITNDLQKLHKSYEKEKSHWLKVAEKRKYISPNDIEF